MQNIVDTAYNDGQQIIQSFMDSLAPVLDKLAGTKSELKLSFDDLTLDMGAVKAKLQGYIVLSVIYSNTNQQKTQIQPETQTTKYEDNTMSKTVVYDVSI